MRMLAVTGLWAAIAVSVWAADPKAEAKPDARSDDPEGAAAMERARKQAANPLRVILAASKVRRKAGTEPEAAPARPESVLAGRPAGNGAALAAAVPLKPSAATAPGVAPDAGRLTAALDKAAPSPSVSPRTSMPMPMPMPAAAEPSVEAKPGASVPTGSPPAPLASLPLAATAAPTVLPVAAPVAAAVVVQPKLREMVEPVIPPRVLDEVGKLGAVQADLLIRADGTVAQVTLVPPVPRQLARYVISAMERWRFEPLAAEVQHRVQLVFNDER